MGQKQLAIFMLNRKIIIATFSLAVPFLPLRVLSQDTLFQNWRENTARSGYVGFAVEDEIGFFQEVAKLDLDRTKECFSQAVEKETAFISDSTPTTEDRRVIITNITKD